MKHYTVAKNCDKNEENLLERKLKLLFEGKGRGLWVGENLENSEADIWIENLKTEGLVFQNSCRKNSQIQNKGIRIKKFIETRIGLRFLGVQEFNKYVGLEDFMQKFDFNWEAIRVDIAECFDDRQYMVKAIEDMLGEGLVNLVQDVPEAMDSLQNYFSFNPRR